MKVLRYLVYFELLMPGPRGYRRSYVSVYQAEFSTKLFQRMGCEKLVTLK